MNSEIQSLLYRGGLYIVILFVSYLRVQLRLGF